MFIKQITATIRYIPNCWITICAKMHGRSYTEYLRTSYSGDFEPKPCTFQWRVAWALEPFFEPIPLNWLKIKKMEPNVSHEDIVFMTS